MPRLCRELPTSAKFEECFESHEDSWTTGELTKRSLNLPLTGKETSWTTTSVGNPRKFFPAGYDPAVLQLAACTLNRASSVALVFHEAGNWWRSLHCSAERCGAYTSQEAERVLDAYYAARKAWPSIKTEIGFSYGAGLPSLPYPKTPFTIAHVV
jgi:hypothetical protein